MTIKAHLIEYSGMYKYFRLRDFKEYLKKRKIKFSLKNLKSYLYILKKQGVIHSAGRGWYSVIKKELILDTKAVERIVTIIKKEFPEIKFSCWSTEQLKEFFHHVPFVFLIFVYTEKDFLVYLKELLEDKEFNVYENPLKKEAEKFLSQKENTVILRSSIKSRAKIEGTYSKIEKVLVDLYLERQKLNLMDKEEYKRILRKILEIYRINMAEMLDYANRRGVALSIKKILASTGIIPTSNYDKI